MKNFKNIICGFILPILLLIVLPYIGFWLYNQNYIHNYIEQSIMNGKYMQEIFVRLVWGILIGIYMLWLNKSSTFLLYIFLFNSYCGIAFPFLSNFNSSPSIAIKFK